MNINTYENTIIDVGSNSDIAGFHMADSSTNKKAIGKAVKKKDRGRQKLDSINEKVT